MKLAELRKLLSKKKIKRTGGEPEGCSAFYVKIKRNIGLKVNFEQHLDKRSLYKSKEWKEARRSVDALRRASSLKIAPKPYGVYPVMVRDGRSIAWSAGVAMEHIFGTHTDHGVDDPEPIALRKKLKKVGITHHDLGGHNILETKDGKLIAIDFDYIKM